MPCDRIIREIILPIANKLVSESRTQNAEFPKDDEKLTEALESQIHNDPMLKGKGHAKLEREFRNLQMESPAAIRIWVEQALDKYVEERRKVKTASDEAFRKLRSGPPDRFRHQLEKSEKSWAVA